MTFDPTVATNAYLATLSRAAHLKAIHYTQGGHWLLLWGWVFAVIADLIVARSRILVRTEASLERRRPRLLLTSFVVAIVSMTAGAVLELPWTVYAQWWREKSYGLTGQSLGGWFGEQAIGLAIGALVGGLFFLALYALIRRAPRTWWAWAAGLTAVAFVFMMIVAPIAIEPIFNRYTPAPPGPTRDAVIALAKTAGVPYDKIYIFNGSKQSNRYTANVSGLFGSARVAMSDTMFAKGADIAEVRGVVGHEMGHYKHMHVIYQTAVFSLLALAIFGVTAVAFASVDRLVGSGATGIADPAGLPTISVIAATLLLLATPLTDTATRWIESDADAFSLRVAEEPDGLSKALVKTVEYRADSPSRWEEAIFYDHPSVRRRVQRAMDWKAAHLKAVEAQEAKDAATG